MNSFTQFTLTLSVCAILAGCAHTTPTVAENKEAPKVTVAKAETKTEKKAAGIFTECTMEKDQRRIANIEWGGGLCRIQYSKPGYEGFVAWAKNQKEFCGKVSENIRTNLSNAGFVCK